MKKNKKMAISIMLVLTIFFITGCSKSQEQDLKSKAISELKYINTKIINMLNKLNNISFESYSVVSQEVQLDEDEKQNNQNQSGKASESSSGSGGEGESSSSSEGSGEQSQEESSKINATNMVANVELEKDRENIDWTTIKSEIESLNESWAVITLDLYTLNVKNDTILNYSDKINASIIAIKNEDKQATLTALADLYASIPEFLEEIDADKNVQKIRQTQSYVINAYILAEEMDNTEIEKNITQAITTYSEIMSDIDYTKDKTEKVNKVYVLLNEMANSLTQKDKDIFYLKYKNFMKEIETIL